MGYRLVGKAQLFSKCTIESPNKLTIASYRCNDAEGAGLQVFNRLTFFGSFIIIDGNF
jgi:hypothetical protein